jgi:hypothetical protein
MRQARQTRGRSSKKGDRAFTRTSGDTEISAEAISTIVERQGLELNEQSVAELRDAVDVRLMETRNSYLTWREAEKAVRKLQDCARELGNAIEDVSSLGGGSDIGRPHGRRLLDSLDYDFKASRRTRGADRSEVIDWLQFVSENIEGEFKSVGGRAAPFRGFILSVRDILTSAGQLPTRTASHTLTALLEAIEGEFPGVVFPPDTVGHSRYSYVRNALGKKGGG